VATVLLLFDSRGGLTEQLAEAVAEGVRSVGGVQLSFRRLDAAEFDDLKSCDALVLGSPNWSGVTGKLKDWLDHSGDLWETGELAGRVGALRGDGARRGHGGGPRAGAGARAAGG
jgi:NAD(P)H dehydrogenase (quinone)